MASEIMQQLSTATSFKSHGDTHLIKVSYQMGAQFEGQLVDHKRSGRGIFMWPNGSKYEGDYLENLRHGKGNYQKLFSHISLYILLIYHNRKS